VHRELSRKALASGPVAALESARDRRNSEWPKGLVPAERMPFNQYATCGRKNRNSDRKKFERRDLFVDRCTSALREPRSKGSQSPQNHAQRPTGCALSAHRESALLSRGAHPGPLLHRAPFVVMTVKSNDGWPQWLNEWRRLMHRRVQNRPVRLLVHFATNPASGSAWKRRSAKRSGSLLSRRTETGGGD
jgi:hypothetical protein